jgi:hypothetical protein
MQTVTDPAEWSADLQTQLTKLSQQQQRAIVMVVMAESRGVPVNRLLKTPYSCGFCGAVVGHSRDGRDIRMAALSAHRETCERRGQPWHFAANLTTYYTKWRRSSDFEKCLNLARQEVLQSALSSAVWILQMGTPEAALELRRQVTGGEKDFDKRMAAVAILDRADLSTAGKAFEPMVDWLKSLQGLKQDDDLSNPAPAPDGPTSPALAEPGSEG